MFKFKFFELREGKFSILPQVSLQKIKIFLLGSFIILIFSIISDRLNIDEKYLWKYYNAFIEKFGKTFRPQSEKEIEGRIEFEVDSAIQRATTEYDRIIQEADSVYKPRYIDEKNDESICYTDECKALAPPMRICAPWLDTCPKQ